MRAVIILIFIYYTLQFRRYEKYDSWNTNLEQDPHDSISFKFDLPDKCKSRDMFFTKNNINLMVYCETTPSTCSLNSYDLKTGRLAFTNPTLFSNVSCQYENSYYHHFYFHNNMAMKFSNLNNERGIFFSWPK